MEIYSKTEDFGENRDYEITLWLCKNNEKNYVIVADMDFHQTLKNKRLFVKTDDSTDGLDEITAKRAIEILNTDLY